MTDPELLAEYQRRFLVDHDPWSFETSGYEVSKRAATLAACGTRGGRRVLELGAANGVLAAGLVPLARALVAVEGVPSAAKLAEERLAEHDQARVVTGLIPGAVPEGPYDLVVASEVLYYLVPEAYARTLEALGRWLAPGGRLVAVHWRPTGPERPRSAEAVHADLERLPGCSVVSRGDTDDYLLIVLERAASDAVDPAPTWVVVPARNEEERIGDALDAIGRAAERIAGHVHLVAVDDGSSDGTAAIIGGQAAQWGFGEARSLAGPSAGSGWARRVGLDHALTAATVAGRPDAVIASTDADSRVPSHWLEAIHRLTERGHAVVAGDVRLEASADPRLVRARGGRLAARLRDVRRDDPDAAHPHFAGANLAFTAAALTQLTPLPTPRALEDDALHKRCRALGLDVVRDASFPVVTSARTQGRAELGLAAALRCDALRLGLDPGVGGRPADARA